MQEILNERGEEKFNELLNTHFLPTEKDQFFFTDDYKEFLAWRQEALWREVQKATGKNANTAVSISSQELDSIEMDESDDENEVEEASRTYWELHSHPQAMDMVDSIIEIIKSISEPTIHYNKSHISIETTGRNFVWCYPRKSERMLVRLLVGANRDQVIDLLTKQGVACKKGRWPSMARLHLLPQDFEQNKKSIADAMRIAENHSLG
jgi:hypothetical protein